MVLCRLRPLRVPRRGRAGRSVALAQDAPWQWPGVSRHLGSSRRNVLAVKVAILHLALRTELFGNIKPELGEHSGHGA